MNENERDFGTSKCMEHSNTQCHIIPFEEFVPTIRLRSERFEPLAVRSNKMLFSMNVIREFGLSQQFTCVSSRAKASERWTMNRLHRSISTKFAYGLE